MPREWTRLTIRVPASQPDLVLALLADSPTLGLEQRDSPDGSSTTLLAYFATPGEAAAAAIVIRRALPDEPAASIAQDTLEDADWLGLWKADLAPVRAGRFVITPPWIAPKPSPGDIFITIEPARAFGTGHHATTRLCLWAIDRFAQPGTPTVDVGAGSGVLAIAAARLGCRPVVAIEEDAEAADLARQQVARNGVAGLVEVRCEPFQGVRDVRPQLVAANLYADLLIRERRWFGETVASGGVLVASGFVSEQTADVERAFADMFTVQDRMEEDGWTALVLARR